MAGTMNARLSRISMRSLGILGLVSFLMIGCASDDLTAGCNGEQWKCGSNCIPLTERCEQACAPGRSPGCNGGCVDPAPWQTDPKNCGACRLDCGGGACVSGRCQRVKVGDLLVGNEDYALGIARGAKGVYVRMRQSLQSVTGATGNVISMSPLFASPALAIAGGYVGFVHMSHHPTLKPGIAWTLDDGQLQGPLYQDKSSCASLGCTEGVSSRAGQFIWTGHNGTDKLGFVRQALAKPYDNGSEIAPLSKPMAVAATGTNKAIVRSDVLGPPALCPVGAGEGECYVLEAHQAPVSLAVDDTHVFMTSFFVKDPKSGKCPEPGGAYRLKLSLAKTESVELVSELDCTESGFIAVDGDSQGFVYYGGGPTSSGIKRRKRDLNSDEETVVQFTTVSPSHPFEAWGSNPTRLYYVDGDKVFYVVL